MRVLYVASAIELGGPSGGSTHVNEVACGLRELGHDVLVVARGPRQRSKSMTAVEPSPLDECGVRVRPVPYRQQLALLGMRTVGKAVRDFRPDVVMERFYNFAGAGIWHAHRSRIPALLEVNAPMVDPQGSLKTRADRLMLGAMRRWAIRQAKWSAAIVTPLDTTVPPEVPRGNIHELPWGANVDRFDPQLRTSKQAELAKLRAELGLRGEGPIAVFLGSFRTWHGAAHFAEAARRLLEGGSRLSFLAIGGGPELAPLRELVRSWGVPEGRIVFTGPQDHARVPMLLSLANIGVAPFDLSAYAPLRTFGFYWSPLKVFEYMSMQMPVVTIDVPPLNTIVRDGQEGLLYPSGNVAALMTALRKLEGDSELRLRMGVSARAHVVARYSWRAHCRALDSILQEITR